MNKTAQSLLRTIRETRREDVRARAPAVAFVIEEALGLVRGNAPLADAAKEAHKTALVYFGSLLSSHPSVRGNINKKLDDAERAVAKFGALLDEAPLTEESVLLKIEHP